MQILRNVITFALQQTLQCSHRIQPAKPLSLFMRPSRDFKRGWARRTFWTCVLFWMINCSLIKARTSQGTKVCLTNSLAHSYQGYYCTVQEDIHGSFISLRTLTESSWFFNTNIFSINCKFYCRQRPIIFTTWKLDLSLWSIATSQRLIEEKLIPGNLHSYNGCRTTPRPLWVYDCFLQGV
jgi:hypothetical protein